MSERTKRLSKQIRNIFYKDQFLNQLRDPSKYDSELIFLSSSYSKWAVAEAFRFIDNHPEYSTESALEIFIRRMDEYSCKARTQQSSFMFSTAKSIAEDILDTLIIEKAFRRSKNECE